MPELTLKKAGRLEFVVSLPLAVDVRCAVKVAST
jgi:hypothetical protein